MEINNPLPADRMYDDAGVLVRIKRIVIGPWNMDATGNITILHGVPSGLSNIRTAYASIIQDDLAMIYPLTLSSNAADPDLLAGGIRFWTDTEISLTRRTGGVFDSVWFNDAIMNRGYVEIWYKE